MAGKSSFRRSVLINRLREAEASALELIATDIVQRAKAKAPVRKIFKQNNKYKRSRAASPEMVAAAIRSIQNNQRLNKAQRTSALYLLQRHPEEARTAIRRHNTTNKSQSTFLGSFREVSLKKNGQVVTSAKVFRGRGRTKGIVPLNSIERNRRPKRGFEPSGPLDDQLSARGRYEIRSGRALTNKEGELVKPGDQPTQVRVGGRLKASISKGAVVVDGSRSTIQVGTPVEYAIYVEFPTRHNAAQPFLLPALHEAKGQMRAIVSDELRSRGLRRG